eukprot:5386394-Alexandrium_andersonii.AAC.1
MDRGLGNAEAVPDGRPQRLEALQLAGALDATLLGGARPHAEQAVRLRQSEEPVLRAGDGGKVNLCDNFVERPRCHGSAFRSLALRRKV